MIKFWKSAGVRLLNLFIFVCNYFTLSVSSLILTLFPAKGKSGCPVRPPETNGNTQNKLLDIEGSCDVDGKYFLEY